MSYKNKIFKYYLLHKTKVFIVIKSDYQKEDTQLSSDYVKFRSLNNRQALILSFYKIFVLCMVSNTCKGITNTSERRSVAVSLDLSSKNRSLITRIGLPCHS